MYQLVSTGTGVHSDVVKAVVKTLLATGSAVFAGLFVVAAVVVPMELSTLGLGLALASVFAMNAIVLASDVVSLYSSTGEPPAPEEVSSEP